MRRVVIESPYAGNVEKNLAYLTACIQDCFARGEAPFASHLMYTGALDDDKPAERELGIHGGTAWRLVAHATVVYQDRGLSAGMRDGIDDAQALGQPVEYRELGGSWRT